MTAPEQAPAPSDKQKSAPTSAPIVQLSAETMAGLRMLAAREAMSYPQPLDPGVARAVNAAAEADAAPQNTSTTSNTLPPPPPMTAEELEGLRQLAAWEAMQ